jgi:hypothetical protein
VTAIKNKISTFDLKKKISRLKKADFDGHTDFSSFSTEQKLLSLSNSAQFWYLTNGRKVQRSASIIKKD